MATYSILGTDRRTDKETVLELDAASEAEAAESAMERGVQIKKIRVRERPEAGNRPDVLPPVWSPSRPRDLADQVERGVFAGVAKLLLCATWLVIGASFLASTTGGIVLASASLGTVVLMLWMFIDRWRK